MKIFKIIYYIFLGVIALIAILLVISIFPITGNYKVMVVLSGSMEPAIKMGSVVVVKPQTSYQIGEVITFGQVSKTKTPTTHRIHDIKVNVGTPIYITKGDANNAPDVKEVSAPEIIGKVLFSVPYVGFAVDTAKKPLGFLFIIIVPALYIIYDEFIKIKKEVKKIKKGKELSAPTEATPTEEKEKL